MGKFNSHAYVSCLAKKGVGFMQVPLLHLHVPGLDLTVAASPFHDGVRLRYLR